jgi:hypothetical protein
MSALDKASPEEWDQVARASKSRMHAGAVGCGETEKIDISTAGKQLRSRKQRSIEVDEPLRVVSTEVWDTVVVSVKWGRSTVPLDSVYGEKVSKIVCSKEQEEETKSYLLTLIRGGEFIEAVDYLKARRKMLKALRLLRGNLGVSERMSKVKRMLRAI